MTGQRVRVMPVAPHKRCGEQLTGVMLGERHVDAGVFMDVNGPVQLVLPTVAIRLDIDDSLIYGYECFWTDDFD